MKKKILDSGKYEMPFKNLRKHEFVLSCEKLKQEKDIRAIDVAKRLLDNWRVFAILLFIIAVLPISTSAYSVTEAKILSALDKADGNFFGFSVAVISGKYARTSAHAKNAMVPKLLVSNDTKNIAPFIDGTGSHAGALLGDVRQIRFRAADLRRRP
jgi:predicted ATP-dependent protease